MEWGILIWIILINEITVVFVYVVAVTNYTPRMCASNDHIYTMKLYNVGIIRISLVFALPTVQMVTSLEH